MEQSLKLNCCKTILIFIPLFFIRPLFCFNGGISDSSTTMNFSYLRDTVFTLHPYFIELNLNTQTGYLHSHEGWTKPFGFSSGTNRLEGGINTKEGLFVIQSKLPKWYSRQFDSTLMLNWMGFNYGIGFHALRGSGYYKYLGKRQSSHGCVRISRALAKELYGLLDIGTPVLVHHGNSAVAIAFGDSTKKYLSLDYRNTYKNILSRVNQSYSGRYFIGKRQNIIIDKFNVGHNGLPVGNSKRILKRQVIKSMIDFVSSVIPPPKDCMMIVDKTKKPELFTPAFNK